MKIQNKKNAGFTLVEIMIVVAIIGLLAAIAIPNFVKARRTSQTNACINNLRQIDGAKQQWALETKATANTAPSDANIAPYIGRDVTAATLTAAGCVCPVSGTYGINALDVAPTCGAFNATDHNAVLQ
jgi:prepilin-type N-terminal cleavage/methylation domain-containing protein